MMSGIRKRRKSTIKTKITSQKQRRPSSPTPDLSLTPLPNLHLHPTPAPSSIARQSKIDESLVPLPGRGQGHGHRCHPSNELMILEQLGALKQRWSGWPSDPLPSVHGSPPCSSCRLVVRLGVLGQRAQAADDAK